MRALSTAFVLAERWMPWAWLVPILVGIGWTVHAFNAPPFLTYVNVPFEVITKTVKPGEVVAFHVVRCSTASTVQAYPIFRTIESVTTGVQYRLPESISFIKPGCTDEVNLTNIVPLDVAPPGRYRLVGLSQVRGALGPFFVPWQSVEFEVTAK